MDLEREKTGKRELDFFRGKFDDIRKGCDTACADAFKEHKKRQHASGRGGGEGDKAAGPGPLASPGNKFPKAHPTVGEHEDLKRQVQEAKNQAKEVRNLLQGAGRGNKFPKGGAPGGSWAQPTSPPCSGASGTPRGAAGAGKEAGNPLTRFLLLWQDVHI